MRKATIFAMALMAGVTMAGSPLKAQAASTNTGVIKKVVVAEKCTLKDCLDKEQEVLKDCLGQLKGSQIGNCTLITIPCIPGVGNEQPETPDNCTPENPDCNTPDNSIPETPSTPDSSTPDINVPELEIPGTETPDNNTPGTETPDNSTPETETPDNGNAETDYHAYVLRVVELVNEERAKAGLNPLTLQKDITEAAQVRAIETVTSFSHTRPDGRHFTTALNEAGVSYRGAGENIAWGQKTPEQVMNGWMNSAGHRANILNAKYTSIGIGYYQNSAGVNYWSQLFTY